MNHNSTLRIEKLRGVGTVELTFDANRRVFVLLGENGIGKTKTLEALFQILLKNCSQFKLPYQLNQNVYSDAHQLAGQTGQNQAGNEINEEPDIGIINFLEKHSHPVVFIGSQTRGHITHQASNIQQIGDYESRKNKYFNEIIRGMAKDFSSLGMSSSIESWFVTIAQSANVYQKSRDNRQSEIETVLSLMHQVDSAVDPSYLQISGEGRVFIKVDGIEKDLTHLSSGYASLLKMFQTIVSGYGYFTNEINLSRVNGYVLIDEIDNHLHLKWQISIIPLLKKVLPNTTFIITSHSPVVVNLLKEGEAYLLGRDEDKVVRSKKLGTPSNKVINDLIDTAFDTDLAGARLANIDHDAQKRGKEALLKLLDDDA